jgi:glycosyltransferase involved in cell wall biosynthesis
MISVITPNKNDFSGLERILEALNNQTKSAWEWIIIDDYSNDEERTKLQNFKTLNNHLPIKILFNETCFGPSYSRNKGLKHISNQTFVFVDSDDFIGEKFIENRLVDVLEFIVYSNMNMRNQKGELLGRFSEIKTDFLEHLLKAKFPWQTSAILWNKVFYNKIGGFNNDLFLLEDIQLSIKALTFGKTFKIHIDNEVDFWYLAKPINSGYRTFELTSKSVELLIKSIIDNVDTKHRMFLKNYYFLSLRYFLKDEKAKKSKLAKHLIFFKKQKVINSFELIIGMVLVVFSVVFSNNTCLKLNRKIFKIV